MALIFISYRRNDTAYLAANLSDKLQEHFGANSVFFDIDNIPLGVDFREYIGNAVGQCDVLLAVIGDHWFGTDNQGNRRIDEPSDYVRVEIESALTRKIPVIPVLVENASMPSAKDLPASIEKIAFRNAAEVRAGRDLRQHTARLIEGLERILKSTPPVAPPDDEEVDEKPDSSAVLDGIRKALGDLSNSHVFLHGAIPADKVATAINTYAPRVSPDDVLFFYDNTYWGGAKDGILLTSESVYWRNAAGKAGQVYYSEIESVDVKGTESLWVTAKVVINQDELEVAMADKGKLSSAIYFKELYKTAEAIAAVVRYLAGRRKKNSAHDQRSTTKTVTH